MSKVGKLPVAIPAGVTVNVKASSSRASMMKLISRLKDLKFSFQLRTMQSRQMLIMVFTEALSTTW